MKNLSMIVAILAVSVAASAANVETSGWETFPAGDTGVGIYATDTPKPTDNTEPVLGSYLGIIGTVDNTIAHSGQNSLKLVDDQPSDTPEAYVGWVENLQHGDTVTASFWIYDTTPGASPSGRIWAHYNEFNDINDYAGSLTNLGTYSDGSGWSQVTDTWTFDALSDPDRTGIVIAARTYSNPGDTIWIDDIEIIAPDYAVITKPELPEPATMSLLAVGGLALLRRKK